MSDIKCGWSNEYVAKLETELSELRARCAEYDNALEQADDRIRQMQADKEISMQEMIIALKPLMWIALATKHKPKDSE